MPSASPTTTDVARRPDDGRAAHRGDRRPGPAQPRDHRLLLAPGRRHGARGDPCSNWCTFATWASRQAGRTIRGEDLLAGLEHELGRDAELLHPVDSLWRALVRRGLFRRDSRLGRLVGRPAHARSTPSSWRATPSPAATARSSPRSASSSRATCATATPTWRPTRPPFAAFLDGLRPGEPPDGQRYLRQAFARYQQQRFEPDPSRRAELVVLANLEIGLHEQTRLQPEIGEALDAAATTERPAQRRARAPPARRRRPARAHPAQPRRHHALVHGADAARRRPRARAQPRRALPRGAAHADRRRARGAARALRARGRRADDCGAEDWAELTQRMHYIAHLFRAYHEIPALGSAPFTEAQLERIRAGAVPDGELSRGPDRTCALCRRRRPTRPSRPPG